jgi:hypothetical protein
LFAVRLLVPKFNFGPQLAELRVWLDGQRYSCSRFETRDREDQVELFVEFFDAAHADSFVSRFGGARSGPVSAPRPADAIPSAYGVAGHALD